MKKIKYLFFMIMFTTNGFCGVVIKKAVSQQQEPNVEVSDIDKDQIIATLKNDIKLIDEQMAQCKKQQKGWTAATVIGGLGVVGTGIGAIVQNNQIKDKKSELKNVQDELKALK